MKKRDYIIYPVIAVAVGALAGLLTRQSVKEVFPLLEKPPLTPAGAAVSHRVDGAAHPNGRRHGGGALPGRGGDAGRSGSGGCSWP